MYKLYYWFDIELFSGSYFRVYFDVCQSMIFIIILKFVRVMLIIVLVFHKHTIVGNSYVWVHSSTTLRSRSSSTAWKSRVFTLWFTARKSSGYCIEKQRIYCCLGKQEIIYCLTRSKNFVLLTGNCKLIILGNIYWIIWKLNLSWLVVLKSVVTIMRIIVTSRSLF